LRSRISSVATLCRRFAAVLRRCDAAAFLAIGRVFAEIAPLEKRVDMHLSLLRREEFRESECVSDVAKCVLSPLKGRRVLRVRRIQGQFEHLAEAYFTGFEHDLGEREQGMACSLDYDLDMFTAAVGLAKTSIQAIMKEDGEHALPEARFQLLTRLDIVLDNGGADFEADLFAPIQAVLQKVKSAQAQSRSGHLHVRPGFY
jgi:dynactin 1